MKSQPALWLALERAPIFRLHNGMASALHEAAITLGRSRLHALAPRHALGSVRKTALAKHRAATGLVISPPLRRAAVSPTNLPARRVSPVPGRVTLPVHNLFSQSAVKASWRRSLAANGSRTAFRQNLAMPSAALALRSARANPAIRQSLPHHRFGPAGLAPVPARPGNLPSLAPRRRLPAAAAPSARPNPISPQTAGTVSTHQNAGWGDAAALPQPSFGQALEDLFSREARLPPASAAGFDPRLSPAWPSLKLPYW